ncbi:Rieske 2Fe-2S domain-containing protein [Salinibacterium sp. NG22]|uniref:Rieske 2Fe-2S domain-containing protein n=1 Tax=Salinibacterium sp. NG22 TaxID=2792040 RepID=UPI0018CE5184|nr:Rieske 2Fe-2S domain-containing protein [Salinibacterium sp. NG22]MBH0109629.1 Rieske 2Fe-2S domain-containing protein [Salinibacterium sp. NG22]
MKRLPVLRNVDRLEEAAALDPAVEKTRGVVDAVLRPRWLRDLLHGVPLGHPVHPLGVHVPLGAWISAGVLDALPGTEKASRALVGVGVLGASGTAVAGFADWSKLDEKQQRVGIVHAAVNIVATGFFAASFVQRSRGKHTSGKVLSYAGLAIASGGGYLGGHLTYRQAAGVSHAPDVEATFPSGWQQLAPLTELADGSLEKRVVADTEVVVFRRGDRVSVLSNTCSHLGAELHDGYVVGDDSTPGGACVECPWHQSAFSLDTGEVIHGPATSPQPRFESRIVDGTVEIRLPL